MKKYMKIILLKIHNLILMMRIHQWLKNLFIFLPPFFGKKLFEIEVFKNLLLFFIIFSLYASVVYCFNDIHDIENDKIHPSKSKRPLPSGKLKIFEVVFLMLFCIFLATILLLNYWHNNNSKPTLVIVLWILRSKFTTISAQSLPPLGGCCS